MYPEALKRAWSVSTTNAIPLEDIRPRLMPLLPQIMELDRKIIASGKYVYGPLSAELEAALKAAWRVPGQVVLTKSGTDALILAVWAVHLHDLDGEVEAGVGAAEELEVICPNLTFPSSAFAITMAACCVVDGTPNAYMASRRLLAIPAWPQMGDGQIERVAAAIGAFFAQGRGK
jgi:dTDP-4-amino-4,6-dideoxygalactose transaminase